MIKKIFIFTLLCCSTFIYAESSSQSPASSLDSVSKNIVGGIALFVNGEPITLHAIKQVENALHTDRLRATDIRNREAKRS